MTNDEELSAVEALLDLMQVQWGIIERDGSRLQYAQLENARQTLLPLVVQ